MDFSRTLKAFAYMTTMNNSGSRISLEEISRIESQLDNYELCACIFLLYDIEDVALEEIYRVSESSKRYSPVLDSALFKFSNDFQKEGGLVRWAKHYQFKNGYWSEMLLEALLIIKNYQCAKMWGRDKPGLEVEFLPNQSSTSVHIDLMRKVVFLLLEDLNDNEWKRLRDILSKEARQRDIELPSYRSLPVSFLLSLMSRGLLKTKSNSQKMDFQILCNALESMCLLNWAQEIQSIQKAVNGNVSCYNRDVRNLLRYSLDDKCPGTILILNQEDYGGKVLNNIELENRTGTHKDVNKLKDTFSLLGYKVVEKNNKSARDLLIEIRIHVERFCKDSEDEKKKRCFVVAILAHGNEDGVIGTDAKVVPWDDIRKELRSSKLLGHPRLLLSQACKGQSKVTDSSDGLGLVVVEDGPGCHGNHGDFFEFSACVPHFASYRSPQFGTFFIHSFCKHVLLYGKEEDFHSLKILVSADLHDRPLRHNNRPVYQTPESTDTATKKLYLVPQNVNDYEAEMLVQRWDRELNQLNNCKQLSENQSKQRDTFAGNKEKKQEGKLKNSKVSESAQAKQEAETAKALKDFQDFLTNFSHSD